MTVVKVISGGQNGVDHAGLRAAKACGLATGGSLPKGCKTLDGPKLELITEYGMKELGTPDYVTRTGVNVLNSDGTIRIATNFESPGERCTLRFIRAYNKPYIDVALGDPDTEIGAVRAWLEKFKIKTLNVAGNSERTSPGIGEKAYAFLLEVFRNG